MTETKNPQPLRLRRKHGEGRRPDVTARDGARLVRAQSLRNAVIAGLIVFIVFCLLWTLVSSLTDRVFPWMTLLLGYLLGMAIRYAGRGIDWHFPALAAVFALLGSVLANIVLAASMTASEFGTGTLQILQAVTSMTWPVFFDEVWNVGDTLFALVSAGLAAFFAPRKLLRDEFYALRLWRRESDGHQ